MASDRLTDRLLLHSNFYFTSTANKYVNVYFPSFSYLPLLVSSVFYSACLSFPLLSSMSVFFLLFTLCPFLFSFSLFRLPFSFIYLPSFLTLLSSSFCHSNLAFLLLLFPQSWERVAGFIWLRMGPAAGSCKRGNEPSVPWKAGNFLTRWATISFLRRPMLQEISYFLSLAAKDRERLFSWVCLWIRMQGHTKPRVSPPGCGMGAVHFLRVHGQNNVEPPLYRMSPAIQVQAYGKLSVHGNIVTP
jgi:hypothetical protein